MSRSIVIAAVQMDATPDALESRLNRAEKWVEQAAQKGADLVVLPELFNTGYEASLENYVRAESWDGETIGWMKRTAARCQVHLMGSFLRRQGYEIYNTLLLLAPDGKSWFYNKSYPFMWERAYFRPDHQVQIADTRLGKIGMMICWDVAHVDLWSAYAGRVDLMAICSCPPLANRMHLILPDGREISSNELGYFMRRINRDTGSTFGSLLLRQSAALQTPVVNTTGTGLFKTRLPAPKFFVALYALNYPALWRHFSRANQILIQSDYFQETFIADANGHVLNRVVEGQEGLATARVVLADEIPQPGQKQPSFGISRLTYALDSIINFAMTFEYQNKKGNNLH